MKKLKSIYLLLLSVLVIGAFASCAGSTDDDDGKPDAFKGEAYFTVQVAVAGDTKATSRAAGPQGGEEGDGRETAFENEYKVNNVCVFLYSSTTGISDGEAKIEQAFYFEKPTEKAGNTKYDKVYTFEKKQCLPIVVSKAYHVLVVANAGNITLTYLNKKLSDLRDAHLQAFDASKNFIMTSEEDATTELTSAGGNATGDGTEANPLTVNVDIERLAARIDIDPGDGKYVDSPTTPGTGTYAFDVKDASNALVGGFVLESILPYNNLTSGEFCIKRVGDKTGTTLTYLGDETTTSETDKTATNYVIDPWTSGKKTGSTPSGLTYNVRKLNDASWPSETGYLPVRKVLGSTSSSSFFILDYAMENTTFDNSEEYATGLVFKGKYYELSDWDTTNKQPKAGKLGTDKYYTYTIRHSDPTGTGPKTTPMYYGIVRNNIYRIKIEGVVGEKKGMVLTIAVKKWAKYTHAETSM